MSRDVRTSIDDGLAFLRRSQKKDGSFIGWSSSEEHEFVQAIALPSIFPTALILGGLAAAPAAEDICQKATTFLLDQKNKTWTWNYWQRGSDRHQNQPYPDDLDDTACSLYGMSEFDPALITGEALGSLAKNLVHCETAAGGPYRTWLSDSHQQGWRDVDVAVNANVGRLLASLDVTPTPLENYINRMIEQNALASPYYVSEIPIIYFVSSWYRGPAAHKLHEKIRCHLQDQKTPALKVALLLSSARNFGMTVPNQKERIDQLVADQHRDGSWSAEALYVDPVIDAKQHYAGSRELTTAFALEALNLYAKKEKIAISSLTKDNDLPLPEVIGQTIPGKDLQKRYIKQYAALIAKDTSRQTSGIASQTAASYGFATESEALFNLNLASIHGWLAYTNYDDLLDGDYDPCLVSVANFCLRQSVEHFRRALPNHIDFQKLVQETFTIIDSANAWEVEHARAQVAYGEVRIAEIPDYADLSKLAQRSLGHSLASIGVLLATDLPIGDSEVIHLQSFFHHYLIARQLNDDAHDWQDDLCAGHISAVVAQVLWQADSPNNINLKRDLPQLQLLFWNKTIDEVSDLVLHHIQQARLSLSQSKLLMRDNCFQAWLLPLEQAAKKALTQKKEASDFISAYRN